MNRAFPALGLLLGTLAAALVAVGVARDLDRAGLRPTSAKCDVTATTPAVLRPATFVRPRSFDWQRWSTRLVNLPRPTLPTPPRPAKNIVIDGSELVATLADGLAGDTTLVDALIRSSEGVDDPSKRDVVPFGHVRVGGRLVKLEHRGRPLEVGEAWTGRIHYEPHGRQTLVLLDPAIALTRHRVAPLPGDKLLLWSDDCRALIGWTSAASTEALEQMIVAIHRVDGFVSLTAWSQRQVDRGWTSLASHMKRQAWLATLPPLPDLVPVQSAQRLRGGKR